jgi:hypothetical protein
MAEKTVVIKSQLVPKGLEVRDEDGEVVGVVTDFQMREDGVGEAQALIRDPAMVDKIVNGRHQFISMGVKISDVPPDSPPTGSDSLGATPTPKSRKEKLR